MTSVKWDRVIPQFWFQTIVNVSVYGCTKGYIIWENIKSLMDGNGLSFPPDTATLQAKSPVILVLNRGHFERNRCELKILSQWICNLDILSVLKHVLFFTQYENEIENFKGGLWSINVPMS